MTKLLFFWRELSSTFWFIPVLIVAATVLLAMFLLHLDSSFEPSQDGLGRYLFIASTDSARSVLSTISGAMIGVAGTVFSMTLVVLTMASSQFGSRLIKNFMYVRLNQVVLGTYISTYLYCLLILNTVKETEATAYIPSLSILVALLAAIGNILLLIVFIHRIASSIQAESVIKDISATIEHNVRTLFPDAMTEDESSAPLLDKKAVASLYEHKQVVAAPDNGYLQYVDQDRLLNLARQAEGVVQLHRRSGHYLVAGMPMAVLYTSEGVEEAVLDKIEQQFIIGRARTSQQDIEFSLHQMVEIASRALSPGVNDPYTAIACIDSLTATMCHLAQQAFPPTAIRDEKNDLRLLVSAISYEDVLDTAFHQIRQFSSGSPAVMIRLMEALVNIYSFTKQPNHQAAVIKHAQMVFRAGEQSIKEPNDLADLREAGESLLGKRA